MQGPPRKTPQPEQRFFIDALLPDAMARKCEALGTEKTRRDTLKLFTLALLAGSFIAFGAIFASTVSTGATGSLPYGVERLLGGLAFSLGLILVVIGGAELFTGDNLIVMSWAGGKVRLTAMLRAWGIIYAGNFIGSVATALLVFLSGHYGFGGGAVGATALATAEAKAALPFTEALLLGILCNVLVCLAIWLSFSARTTAGRILAIVPPITAFVAAGFEHSVANMYFLPAGLFIKAWASDSFWSAIGRLPADYPALTWAGFAYNLVPVTIGNLIGGAVLVGIVYWFIYLRHR
jgi:formate/nitrite transporter